MLSSATTTQNSFASGGGLRPLEGKDVGASPASPHVPINNVQGTQGDAPTSFPSNGY